MLIVGLSFRGQVTIWYNAVVGGAHLPLTCPYWGTGVLSANRDTSTVALFDGYKCLPFFYGGGRCGFFGRMCVVLLLLSRGLFTTSPCRVAAATD